MGQINISCYAQLSLQIHAYELFPIYLVAIVGETHAFAFDWRYNRLIILLSTRWRRELKIIRSSLAAVSLCFFATSLQAQERTQAIGTTEVSQPVQTVNISGARRVHLEPQEYMAYEYEYSLSNRDTVRFSRRVGRFYVEIKPNPAVEIFPAAAGQFETRAGARLVFTDGGDSLDIDHYELLQAASGVTVTSLPMMALPGAPK
jgi:hypothetical protein